MQPLNGGMAFHDGLLQGTLAVTQRDRESLVHDVAGLIDRLGRHRNRTTRVSANPEWLDCPTHLNACLSGQSDGAMADHGFDTLEPCWGDAISTTQAADGAEEGTSFTLVAQSPKGNPAGHIRFDLSVLASARQRRLQLCVEPVVVYVSTKYRGRGYSIDLSIVAGWVISHIALTVIAAVPAGWSYRCAGTADHQRSAGDPVAKALWIAAEAAQAESDTAGIFVEPLAIDAFD